jgi:hypothetical protein
MPTTINGRVLSQISVELNDKELWMRLAVFGYRVLISNPKINRWERERERGGGGGGRERERTSENSRHLIGKFGQQVLLTRLYSLLLKMEPRKKQRHHSVPTRYILWSTIKRDWNKREVVLLALRFFDFHF